MTDRSWKALERRIASQFNTMRTPLSGSNSRQTSSDTLSDKYYIEVKERARLPFWDAYLKARGLAQKEGKRPLLAFHKKGYKGTIVMLTLEDFLELEEENGTAHMPY